MCDPFSFQLSDQTVNSIFRFVCGKGYIRSLKDNVKALERGMEDLEALEVELQNKVKREEDTGYCHRIRSVQLWLERVEKIDTKYKNLLSTRDVQLQKLCLCGLFSKNVCSSYKYGKKVSELLEDVEKLKSECNNFGVVTEPTPRSGDEMLTQPTIGQEIMLEKAWKRLMEDKVGIMGLHGMGGVGKTTLLMKINNKFIEKNNEFTEKASNLRVIWVVVSKGKNISKLQDDIAIKLNLPEEVWRNQNESDKAIEIHRFLKEKTFVLLLDDIWEAVDLVAIGVPIPTRENKCKVAFTTRFQEVCGNMGDTEPMQVKCLKEDEAWELFEKNAGVEKFRSDPDILKVAKRVAEKCCGLPLALNIVGKTMLSKTTVHEWEYALELLTRSAAEFSKFGDKVLTILKYSYDSLGDEHIKSCFLYCVLYPEDALIVKEDLIEYWRCEGFMRESQDIGKGINEGYEILGTLIRANLLMEIGTIYVGMHDMVREMALWIASDLGKQKYNFFVQAGVGLCKVPELKDWGAVKRMSLMKNIIEEITCNFKCSELTTLFLQGNNLRNLSSEFIRPMQKLVVLDISENHNFNKLPEHISELVSLQYLNLASTSIEQLPVGFQELQNLIHLNLNYTSKLCSIRGISKLSSLRILELLKSNVHGDINLFEELSHLKDLQVLNLTISSKLGLEQILRDEKLTTCINGLHILGFQQEPLNISSLVSMENLRGLFLENSHVSEIVTDTKSRDSTSPCFGNLYIVEIKECNSIKDLTWLLFAPNLVGLEIEDSKEVEEIINKEKATNLIGIITTLFQKLEYLGLKNLPKLESIYWSTLPFPVLLLLKVKDCQKLRKFPLNASSAPRLVKIQIELSYREQLSDSKPDELSDSKVDELSDSEADEISFTGWDEDDTTVPNNLEWEDEDTENRFLPLIMKAANGQTMQEMQ